MQIDSFHPFADATQTRKKNMGAILTILLLLNHWITISLANEENKLHSLDNHQRKLGHHQRKKRGKSKQSPEPNYWIICLSVIYWNENLEIEPQTNKTLWGGTVEKKMGIYSTGGQNEIKQKMRMSGVLRGAKVNRHRGCKATRVNAVERHVIKRGVSKGSKEATWWRILSMPIHNAEILTPNYYNTKKHMHALWGILRHRC